MGQCQLGHTYWHQSSHITWSQTAMWVGPTFGQQCPDSSIGVGPTSAQFILLFGMGLLHVTSHWDVILNSLALGRFQFNFRSVIFKLILVNDGWGISYEIALRWMPPDCTDDKSTLVQVMAWCRQATSHYLSQCWLRSVPPNGITRPQWAKFQSWSHLSVHMFLTDVIKPNF